MTLSEYIKELDKQYQTGGATEHSYRPALKSLLDTILPHLTAVNEPKRSACGAPDYILYKGEIPMGFLEAKDFTKTGDLTGKKENKEQFERYKKSLSNIIFTDYLDFLLYEDGEFIDSVRIGDVKGEKIVLITDNEAKFINLIERLGQAKPQKITSSKKLAQIMAGKARLLAEVIEKSLNAESHSELHAQMMGFRDVLIHDIEPKGFADIYAQTIAYGMFAARLHDPTPETFSRMEAATLIPKSNPFLRQIFQSIAGYDLDERIAWIVDDLAEVFRATDVERVMKGYGKRTRQTDPMLHFYEDFLEAYDSTLRKSRGVWYTPQPAVSYIVRAVDEILQLQFGLPMGLADTSKIKASFPNQKRKKTDKDTYEEYIHKVQVLDPATGTGTFLAEVVSAIHEKMAGMKGMWQSYVEEHLLPRINGFELLMASYAMAHLKLDMLLSETGYTANLNKRLRVYLTNSLEEHHPDTGTLFVQALANEANQANHIKRDTPVMVVVGNPPYSGESANKGKWIMQLMDGYKKEPGGFLNLQERNPKWINDDYCKFIRLGQEFVDKNNEGVLAYINNHSFLDNPTFRGMRWHLMNSFDKIYIIDLHGNSKKKEVAPDGSKDENVFDIQQGVSINIFVKTGKKTKGELAQVFHLDIYGKRQLKYDFLAEHTFSNTPFVKLEPKAPMYFFIPRNTEDEELYNSFFAVNELFLFNSVGIVTARDNFTIHHTKEELKSTIEEFLSLDDEAARSKFALGKDSRDWQVAYAKADLKNNYPNNERIAQISYRPFDNRYTFFTGKSKGFYSYPRTDIMSHLLNGENVALMACKQTIGDTWEHVGVSKHIVDDSRVSNRTKERGYVFPLYLYPTNGQTTIGGIPRSPNLNYDILEKISDITELDLELEKSGDIAYFAPIDILDYVYGILHTPSYRERYKEFLKVDFPRIPYPESKEQFRNIAAIGSQLRKVHLLEELPQTKVTFPESGSGTVESISTKPINDDTVNVYINTNQYFGNVSASAYNFYIGGYQPAQKWLKDRKGITLNYDDIMHYMRIIAAQKRTIELMEELETMFS